MTKFRIGSLLSCSLGSMLCLACLPFALLFSGCGGGGPSNFGSTNPSPTVSITASPTSIAAGESATLTVTASNATAVTVTGSDGSSYTLQANGGTESAKPTATTTYTATATGAGGTASATATVTMASTPTPTPTVTITANPNSITAGGSSTLTVTATNATQVTVSGSDGATYKLAATGGTQSVTPSVTTTYTATATGPSGSITATASVSVGAAAAPTVQILANPTSDAAGSTSTLTVTATNATQVIVTGTDGSTYTLGPTGGTLPVTPSVTTTYTATATGAGGTITATAKVTVVPPMTPTVTISANPTTINDGGSSTLTVTATNATAVKVTGTDGTSYPLQASGGTSSVRPTTTTTYTATASGPGGTITATAIVTVTPTPAPTVTITANPNSITAGGSSTLTVTATNATQVTVSGSDGATYKLAATGGTQSVTPSVTTTYTATATGPSGSITATASVSVGAAAAPTVQILANPTSDAAGSTSTLTVTATNATQVIVTGTDGSTYTLGPTGGTLPVTPSVTTTYTATATGAGGTITATAKVTVVPPMTPTVTISANPTTITTPGNWVILTVTATNATSVVLTGTDGVKVTLTATGGKETVVPIATATYTATASGPGGTITAKVTVTVTDTTTGISLTANPMTITAGGSSKLTVIATNATTVTLTGSNGSSYPMTATGGTVSVSPTSTTTYTATAIGAAGPTGAASEMVKVTVTPANSSPVLTVTSAGTGAGTVTSTPAGINCPQTCTANFPKGKAVVLTATPEAGTTFAGWSGPCTGLGTCNLTLEASTTVTPTFEQGTAGLTSLKHIIFFAQENRSLDNYFGAMREYWKENGIPDQSFDGLPQFNPTSGQAPLYGPPPAIPGCNPADPSTCDWDTSNMVASFHMISVCNENTSPSWNEAHVDWNYDDQVGKYPAKNNGFVHTAAHDAITNPGTPFFDTIGLRAMGYWDGTDLNYDYFMASNFATSDRFFHPILARTELNREYLEAATTAGRVNQNGTDAADTPQLTAKPIWEELQDAGITWKVYINGDGTGCPEPYQASCLIKTVAFDSFTYSQTALADYPQNIAPITEYFSDLENGTLPQVAEIYAASDAGLDEHGSDSDTYATNVQKGAQYTAKLVNALMESSSWQNSAFIFTFDESGGLYDHVPPQPTVSPDGIPPIDFVPEDVCNNGYTGPTCNFVYTGYRIPLTVISPFAKKNYVSHTVMDTTAWLKLVEERFNLPALNKRDAAQPDMTEFFDFNNPPWMSPPVPPQQNVKNPCYLNKLP